MKVCALAALLGAVLAAMVLLLPRREDASLYLEPDDGVQPPDPRPAAFVWGTPTQGTATGGNVPYWTIGTTQRQTH